jgi:hypothetical protein
MNALKEGVGLYTKLAGLRMRPLTPRTASTTEISFEESLGGDRQSLEKHYEK